MERVRGWVRRKWRILEKSPPAAGGGGGGGGGMEC